MKTIKLQSGYNCTHDNLPALIFVGTLVALCLLNGLTDFRLGEKPPAAPTPALHIQAAPIILIATAQPQPPVYVDRPVYIIATPTTSVKYVTEVPPAPVEAPAAEPAVIDALPTPSPEPAQVAPTPDPAFVKAVVNMDDPNGLACNGSPLCGGLTNAEAATAFAKRQGQP